MGPCDHFAFCLRVEDNLRTAVQLRVIQASQKPSEASAFIAKINAEYHDVLFNQFLAKDVDPALRGPYGVATIELSEGAAPHKRRPFRMQAERGEALRKVIESYLAKDWIEPSASDRSAQAFLVAKSSGALSLTSDI